MKSERETGEKEKGECRERLRKRKKSVESDRESEEERASGRELLESIDVN